MLKKGLSSAVLTVLLGALSLLFMGQAVAQTTMPAAGGQWEVDGSEPSDVMIGPLGVPKNK
jgi:hypothetical protein